MLSTLEAGVSAHDTPVPHVERSDSRFQRRTVRSLNAATPSLVTPRDPHGHGIATVSASAPDTDLAGWIARHRDELVERLADEGALLLRGFCCDTPAALERAVVATGDALYDTTEHPRTQLGRSVFTPVTYPSREFLFARRPEQPPADLAGEDLVRVPEACPDSGGETVGRRRSRGPRRHRFGSVKAHRVGPHVCPAYGGGLGRDWRAVFATDDRDAVEEQCRAHGLSWSWDQDTLTTRTVQPGVKRHPGTGKPCWVGQLLHFHPAALPAPTRAALTTLYGTDGFLRDCRHADRSPIDDAVVAKVIDAYRAVERACRWQVEDLLLVDNVRAAHGRRAYDGARKLLVMLTEPIEHDP